MWLAVISSVVDCSANCCGSFQLEHLWDELQLEHAQLEEHCSALESELRSVSNQHDSDIERMRQDVLTAVHAIKANETEIGLSDRVSTLTKRLGHQKDNFMVSRLTGTYLFC